MILVFGKYGQVATELHKQHTVICLGRDECDLMTPNAAALAITHYKPKAVINAAAYTGVDKAETERSHALRINGTAVAEMAHACADEDIPLVHISTDYVFSGDGTKPWHPDQPTAPLGTYGESKLRGENAIRKVCKTYAILRTSWVFSAHGANFVKTMLRLGSENAALNIVADQFGGPTPAKDIAAACLSVAHHLQTGPHKSGTYHFAGAPDTTWANFADSIFRCAKISCDVTGIPSQAYPTPARRPLNSRMDCSTTLTTFGIPRPNWEHGLQTVIKDLGYETA